jgi:ABC-type microcin C transport system permease subunit YejB
MLALVMLYLANVVFGTTIGGLMDPSFIGKPWSWAKIKSILEHSWIPVFIIGAGGTAGMIRKMRANLLDELQKQYVVTARAKGLPPGKVLRKVSAADGAQLLHLRHRQPVAAHHFRRRDHRGRAVAADTVRCCCRR